MLSGPGISAGFRSPALVWHADTRATVLDLAGIDVERDSEGASLMPLALGRENSLRSNLGAAYRMSQRAIQSDNLKLIRYFHRALVPPSE